MKKMVTIPKPKHKMKTLIKYMEQCYFGAGCTGCPYDEGSIFTAKCRTAMMQDALYYLRQTLEKSEGKDEG